MATTKSADRNTTNEKNYNQKSTSERWQIVCQRLSRKTPLIFITYYSQLLFKQQ